MRSHRGYACVVFVFLVEIRNDFVFATLAISGLEEIYILSVRQNGIAILPTVSKNLPRQPQTTWAQATQNKLRRWRRERHRTSHHDPDKDGVDCDHLTIQRDRTRPDHTNEQDHTLPQERRNDVLFRRSYGAVWCSLHQITKAPRHSNQAALLRQPFQTALFQRAFWAKASGVLGQ